MTHIILVRHSIVQPEPGVSAHKWTLTAEGRSRCAALADQLRPYHVTHVATSDEPKAYATGQLLAAHLEVARPITVEPNFRETRRDTAPYFDSENDFRAAIRAAMNAPEEIVFGEESFADARRRFTSALRLLLNAHMHDTIAVVTHGTVMSLMLGHSAGVDTYQTWQELGMPAFAVLTPNFDLLDLRSING